MKYEILNKSIVANDTILDHSSQPTQAIPLWRLQVWDLKRLHFSSTNYWRSVTACACTKWSWEKTFVCQFDLLEAYTMIGSASAQLKNRCRIAFHAWCKCTAHCLFLPSPYNEETNRQAERDVMAVLWTSCLPSQHQLVCINTHDGIYSTSTWMKATDILRNHMENKWGFQNVSYQYAGSVERHVCGYFQPDMRSVWGDISVKLSHKLENTSVATRINVDVFHIRLQIQP